MIKINFKSHISSWSKMIKINIKKLCFVTIKNEFRKSYFVMVKNDKNKYQKSYSIMIKIDENKYQNESQTLCLCRNKNKYLNHILLLSKT